MMRCLAATCLSLAGLFCIYAATTVAPDMRFPVTPIEWMATDMVIIGLLLVVMGQLVLVIRR